MKKLFTGFPAEICLFVYLLLFLFIKQPYHDWDRVINSDGKAYYGYLTALFIYHDLDYSFVDAYEEKYYPSDKSVFKEIRQDFKGEKVNIAFPGLAVLWLPFFLLAHALSAVTGFETDGYSLLYQYAIGLATLFYLWAGLRFLWLLLKRFEPDPLRVALVLFLIALGTNIIYYAIVEPSMAHVYNFALLNAFFYFSARAIEENKARWYAFALFAFALAAITRPTNGIFLVMLLFLAGSWKQFVTVVTNWRNNPKAVFFSLLTLFLVFMIPPLLWYAQTGYFFVYTYGEAGFDFAKPQIFSILFSFHKGWFIYTPVAFLAMFGFAALYSENRFRFTVLLLLLLVHVYIASSWWNWHYASKFSQRVFIDFYGIVGILLLYLFRIPAIKRIPSLRWSVTAVLLALLGLNGFQFYQQRNWVFPATYITRDIYFDSFLRTRPVARVFIPEEQITAQQSLFNNLKNPGEWSDNPQVVINDSIGVLRIDSFNVYSPACHAVIEDVFTNGTQVVVAGAHILSSAKRSECLLVVEVGTPAFTYSYNPFFLGKYNEKGKWIQVEFALKLPEPLTGNDRIKMYLYNGSANEQLWIDNMWLHFITLKEDVPLPYGIALPFNSIASVTEIAHIGENAGDQENRIFRCDADNRFIPVFDEQAAPYFTTENRWIIVSATAAAEPSTDQSRLVFHYFAPDDDLQYEPVFFTGWLVPGSWKRIDAISKPPPLNEATGLKIYFWNPSDTEALSAKNITVKFISLKNSQL